jgi:hypothetical protein
MFSGKNELKPLTPPKNISPVLTAFCKSKGWIVASYLPPHISRATNQVDTSQHSPSVYVP